MGRYVLRFDEIDRSQIAIVGGKAANLGELSRIEGVRVPNGFCVTTDAFERILAEAPSIDERIDRLSELAVDDQAVIHKLSGEIREIIESVPIPQEVSTQILQHLTELDGTSAFAIRSSATAEDLPFASFAGQQDSFLNIKGADSILQHISRCWGSLFTERAATYRLRNGFDHRKIQMAVVVQQMVNPISSGILFTADPVSGNRKTTSIEAIRGLGEALVSGQVNADVYTVRDGVVVAKSVSAIDPKQSRTTQGVGREE